MELRGSRRRASRPGPRRLTRPGGPSRSARVAAGACDAPVAAANALGVPRVPSYVPVCHRAQWLAPRKSPAQENQWPRGRGVPGRLTKMIDYSWRGTFTNAELNALHAEGFDHKVLADDWLAPVTRHSLGLGLRPGRRRSRGLRQRPVGWGHPRLHPRHPGDRTSPAPQGQRGAPSPSPPTRPRRRAASGCTSTSRTTSARSTSAAAASPPPTPASSPWSSPGTLHRIARLQSEQRDVQRRPRLGRPEVGAEDALDPPQPLVEGRPGQVRLR